MKKICNCFVGINLSPSHILDSLQQNTSEISILNDIYSQKSQNCMCQILWQNLTYVGHVSHLLYII